MASSRYLSNGRSNLVRKQSQITTFFSPGKSPTPTPTLTPTPNSNPNPNPKSKQIVPLLAIPSPAASTPGKKSYSSKVVGKRIRDGAVSDVVVTDERIRDIRINGSKRMRGNDTRDAGSTVEEQKKTPLCSSVMTSSPLMKKG